MRAQSDVMYVQGTRCTHSDLPISVFIVYSAPALNFLSAMWAGCAHTYVRITVQCTQCAHTDVFIIVQCTQCAHLQYSAHSALTYNTMCTVRPKSRHNTVRTVLLLRPQCPLYFSTFCTVDSHCCRYFSRQSNVRPQSGSCKFKLSF